MINPQKANFIAWLNSRIDDDDVGDCRIPERCPIANYLRSEGVKMPCVGFTIATDHFTEQSVDLQTWARLFIDSITGSRFNAISAKQALEIVNNIKEDDN